MIILTLILTLMAFGMTWLSKRRYGDILAPLGLFSMVWFGMLALETIPIVSYTPVSAPTWIMLVGAGITFAVGALLASPPSLSPPRQEGISAGQGRSHLVGIALIFAIGLIGTGAFISLVNNLLGWQVVLEDPRLFLYTRRFGDLTKLGVVGIAYSSNVVLLPLVAMYVTKYRRMPIWLWAVVIYALAVMLMDPSRTMLLVATSWAVFAWLYMERKRRAAHTLALVALAVGFGVFFLLSQARLLKGTFGPQNYLYDYSNLRNTPFEGFLDAYIYATGSVPAFDVFVRRVNLDGFTYGFETFGPVLRLANVVDPRVLYPKSVRDFSLIPFPYNTYTFLDAFYSDFGWLGVLLGPFLMGLVSQNLYRNAREKGSFLSVYAASWMASILLSTFNVNRLTWIITWYYLFIGVVFSLLVAGPRRAVDGRAVSPSPAASVIRHDI
jgi:oligosaccharide repeat unit polymerase